MIAANKKRLGGAGILVALTGLFAIGGCNWPGGDGGTSPGDESNPPPGEVVRSEKERKTSPVVSAGDQAELAAGNRAFAFNLYQQVRDWDGNIFYSPHSISLALAMTYAGARDETEQQMADALRFTLPQDRLHPAFNALDLELAGRGENTSGTDGDEFRLNIVNRIWGWIDYEFLSEFLDTLAENYGAELSLLDFVGAPEASRIAINDWISDQTEGRIEDLIPPGSITPLTRLVLTNAIYFLGAWSHPFDEAATRDQPFYLLDGSQVDAAMMRQGETFGYAAGDGYQAVELPYEGNELSMVILLPDAGRFEEFDAALEAARVETILQDLNYRAINLSMPKFTFEWEVGLASVLSAMGMPIAFDAFNADFSGMTDVEQLYISGVIHKAFVAVDEEGTEAAAATAVVVGTTSVEPEPELVVTVDRPFVFLIRDVETEAILFVGRVMDPSES